MFSYILKENSLEAKEAIPKPGRTLLLDALDRDILHVEVLAVVAVVFDPEESFLELDKFESCEVFLVISHEVCRLLGSSNLKGIPQ